MLHRYLSIVAIGMVPVLMGCARGQKLWVEFRAAEGVVKGTSVLIGGKEVGKVGEIMTGGGKTRLLLLLKHEEAHTLPEDSKFTLVSRGASSSYHPVEAEEVAVLIEPGSSSIPIDYQSVASGEPVDQ